MHILICPNAFKNSIDATAAAKAIEEGIQQSHLQCTTACIPVGDGGDGTGQLLTAFSNGVYIDELVHDPLGRKIKAKFGLIDNEETAVIEMASASGLRLLKKEELNPLQASSFGTGELMIKALDKGVKKIILCVGGSATVDGGCGIARALGIRFYDAGGNDLKILPKNLTNLSVIDMNRLDKRIRETEIIILADVTNPLLGKKGAAEIFGPQKGASEKQVVLLEAALTQLSQIVFQTLNIDISTKKYGGAAGGTAAGLNALFNAQIVNGIDFFLETTRFDDDLQKADLVITGEGSIDLQTLDGKAPFGVAKRAKEKNIPVIGLAGKLPEKPTDELAVYFDELININGNETDITSAMLLAKENLIRTSWALGNRLANKQNEI